MLVLIIVFGIMTLLMLIGVFLVDDCETGSEMVGGVLLFGIICGILIFTYRGRKVENEYSYKPIQTVERRLNNTTYVYTTESDKDYKLSEELSLLDDDQIKEKLHIRVNHYTQRNSTTGVVSRLIIKEIGNE